MEYYRVHSSVSYYLIQSSKQFSVGILYFQIVINKIAY